MCRHTLSHSYLYEPVEPGSAAPSDEEEEVEEELAALDLLYSIIQRNIMSAC